MIKKKYLKKNIGNIIITLTIIFLCLAVPSIIALNKQIYFHETKNTSAENEIENATHFYENVHEFLLLQKPLSQEFTDNETSHMKDVRLMFNILRFLALIILIFYVTYFVHIQKKYKQNKEKIKPNMIKNMKMHELEIFFESIKKGAIISLILILLLILFATVNFSWSFSIFHQIFFPQGNWTFSVNSLLITLFPQSFFVNITKKILIMTIASISILIISTMLIEKQFKKNKSKTNKKSQKRITTKNDSKK